MSLLIKLCGMTNAEQIKSASTQPINWMGFIFVEQSPRYYSAPQSPDVNSEVKKTGVFFNANLNQISTLAKQHQLSHLQLHGEESAELCKTLMELNYTVIKVIGIKDKEDFERCNAYVDSCHYFLFDTKAEKAGGNGFPFNHHLLENYRLPIPFILSGGISSDQVQHLLDLKKTFPLLAGIDINSRFEISPGIKDLTLVQQFTDEIRKHEQTI